MITVTTYNSTSKTLKKYFTNISFSFYILVTLFFIPKINSAKENIDSTLAVFHRNLSNAKSENAKALIYMDMCWYLRYISLDSCVKYGNLGIKSAKLINDKKLEADITRYIGISYWQYALEEESLEWIYASLHISEKIDDKSGIAYCYDNLGNIFFGQGIYDKALQNFQKGKEIFESINDKKGLSYSYIHLCWVYTQTKQIDSAFENIKRSIQVRKQLGDTVGVSVASYDLANIYRAKGDYNKAINLYHAAIDRVTKAGLFHNLVGIQQQVSETYRLMGKFDSSIYYGKESLALSKKFNNYRQIIRTSKTLILVYEQLNDYQSAYTYQKMFYENKEKLINDKIALKLNRKELEQEFERRENQIKTKSLILISAITFILLGAILTILIIYRNQKKTKKYNKALQQKNDEISQQKIILEQQTEELKKLNEVKNKMFSVVSHDIRSPLASLKSMLDLYNKDAITEDEIKTLMPEITTHVINTSIFVDNLLYWSKSQFTGVQENKSYFNIIQTLQREIQLADFSITQKKIKIEYNYEQENLQVFADENMISIVLRNLINNAVKFSNILGSIEINVYKKENRILTEIIDYGKGMKVEQIQELFISNKSTTGTLNEKGTGLGLMLCKDFCEKNNGKIFVESTAGSGSKFILELPTTN